MRFWDTSALIPLWIDEPASELMAENLREDGTVVLWWGTAVEIASTLARAEREGRLDAEGVRATLTNVRTLLDSSGEIRPTEPVRSSARRLLRVHPLRAADALQLAAALAWCEGNPQGERLVSLDHRLRAAAEKEGFEVIPADLP